MSYAGEPIAIIGTGCRFPGNSNTPSKLWDLLREPRDLLEPLCNRFSERGWYHQNGKYHGHCNVQKSYLLGGPEQHRRFDARFFGINAVEANTMDPQMRLLLETVYEALEAAGQPIERLRGSDTAVYTGMMGNSYKTAMERDLDSIGTYHVSGTSRAMMSNRISYFFDWRGPSMTIDTACSSSMIAVHQAVSQLRSGQSRVAVAAGSNLLLDPADYVSMSNLEMLSHESRSRMWDKDANGYARGEGVAAVILKTLNAAEADGDHIECVIRETATNQDGKTMGITMPSAAAQTQLIQDCYTRAGLNLTDPAQRPQYFEAHGTGTPAGDPIEAEAITNAFFPKDGHAHQQLFVGGVKTVMGHSESVAGLAGLIKTSLALQNCVVPPNLLFHEINPKVKLVSSSLQIPTSAVPWPAVRDGCPRRASVNSFGFGGSNAHAILESYTPTSQAPDSKFACFIPFVFSAASVGSLFSYLGEMRDHLRANEKHIDMRDLAITLYSRRSRLPFGLAITASTPEDLCQRLEEKRQEADGSTRHVDTRLSLHESGKQRRKAKVLGIFTGQGAQSARMGAALIEQSGLCQRVIDRLEARLASLPTADRPPWSLKQELLKDDSAGLGRATLSQPLCTSLQILQVDLLRAAGVEFSAIVGHSSGEIGAAYCAGMITAEDAILIAYYRGLHSSLALSSNGQQGAMLAVGTSFKDAHDLCSEEEFQGRVWVAAINSPTSVTLSGDKDAIDEIKIILEDEGKFCRSLRVNIAYHSPHMAACSGPYLSSLQGLGVLPSKASTPWFSSVKHGKLMDTDESIGLGADYWNNNMVEPVLFKQAIEEAWKSQGPFDMAIEIGPHPALKGPALETIQDLSKLEISYTGVHSRGKNAVESFSNALGYLWAHTDSVDLLGYERFVTACSDFNLISGLPPYAWDHEKEYWHESRYTKAIRTRPGPVHELLGHLTPDSTDQDMRWRNILCPNELPSLKGHVLQQQSVFPGAGYAVAAIEAAAAVARARGLSISLIEILDLDIIKALAFDTDESRMETISSLTDIRQHGTTMEALFRLNAAPTLQGTSFTLHASGHLRVTFGEGNVKILPDRVDPELSLFDVDSEEFYSSLSKFDYQYTGPFRALTKLKRRLGLATGSITRTPSQLLVHPAVLDVAFQSLFLAQAAPNNGGVWSLVVPKTIRAIRVNGHLCAANTMRDSPLTFQCVQPEGTSGLKGDVDLFVQSDGTERAILQIEGLQCVPLAPPNAQDDKSMFVKTVWDVARPDAEKVTFDGEPTSEQLQLARLLERMSGFYLRHLDSSIPKHHTARLADPYQHYLRFASQTISRVNQGEHPLWSSEWDNDSSQDINAAYEPYLHIADVKLLKAIGDNIVDIVTGQTQAIEVGMQDGMLTKMYEQGLGFQEHTRYLARVVRQIVHRYPHMDILEIGAGTGGATKKIFQEIEKNRFSSYTYTDISPGFFETAQEVFAPHVHKMIFKVLDISKGTGTQDFNEHSYDLIIAAAVLHATPNLRETLRNVRRLLKPGGSLVVLELHVPDVARVTTTFGALPGWWLGADEGRTQSPCINMAQWDALLRATGFSGCDTVTPVKNGLIMPLSVFVSQAVDRRVEFLRDPLSAPLKLFHSTSTAPMQKLILLGGGSPKTLTLIAQLKSTLRHQWGDNITTARSLAEAALLNITSSTTILSLLEIDAPIFKDLSSNDWDGLKLLLQEVGTLLWVSSGRRSENPYANMMVGLLRSARHEIPTLNVQCYDVETEKLLDANDLAESLLRLRAAVLWQQEEGHNSLITTIEPEVVKEQTATLLIPRLVASQEMNDRYNSSRRPIFTPLSTHQSGINFAVTESEQQQVSLRQVVSSETVDCSGSVVRITHSLCSAIRVSAHDFLNLVMGHKSGLNTQVVGLTTQHGLMVVPASELSMPVSVPGGREAAFLTLLAYQLLAAWFFEDLAEGDTALIHESGETLAGILADEADRHGAKAVFTTMRTTAPESWLTIHPTAPNRALASIITNNTTAMMDLSTDEASCALGSRLRAQLPSHCLYHRLNSTLTTSSVWRPRAKRISKIHDRLMDCVPLVLKRLATVDCLTHTLSLDAFTQQGRKIPHAIIDWTLAPATSIRVQPADTQIHFSGCRTYWLAGLTGGLGLLLCEWMVRHGAKYIVISSRTPRVEQSWLQRMRVAGAVIKVYSCDITDKSAVSAVYSNMRSTLPAVAGVCQGAMVLEDIAIRDMSLDTLLKVTKPKVEGSLHLDQLFQTQDSGLEFFVFLSSAGSMAGRPGQGNYASANLFMTALAEQRRRRNQAASVMHLGPVFGAGYMTQQGLDSLKGVVGLRTTMFPISEQDFFQHFAEALIAGQPGSECRPLETTSGLVKHETPEEAGPLLSHYTQDQSKAAVDISADKSKVPLKLQLENARGRSAVMRTVREVFLLKLSVLFQIDLSRLEQAEPETLRLDEMGIDSLMAVEIRSWFVKTLQVNIPVLKILSGASVKDLIDTAVDTIPRPLVPGFDAEELDSQVCQGGEPAQDTTQQSLREIFRPGVQPSPPDMPTRNRQPKEPAISSWGPLSSSRALKSTTSETSDERIGSTAAKTHQSMEVATERGACLSTSSDWDSPGSDLYVPTSGESFTGNIECLEDLQTPHELGLSTVPSYHAEEDEKQMQSSFSQSLFWVAVESSDCPINLNTTATFKFTGELEIERLKSAVVALGQQHESLRTRFFVKDGQPMQGIMKTTALSLEHYDIEDESELAKYVHGIHHHVYDLEAGKTIRLALISKSSKPLFLILGFHHLAMDGQSFFPFMNDILQHYSQKSRSARVVQYSDFSQKQHEEFASGGFNDELAFWKNEFAEMPPTLPVLRTSSLTSRPLLQAYGNQHVKVKVGPEIKVLIQALCRRCRATPFHFYLATFRVLLYRYTGSGYFSIGVGDANRTEEDLMESIGDFLNILPLVFRTKASLQFDKVLQETQSKTHAALANSRVPFQLLLNELAVTRSAETTPIFQAFVNYRLARGDRLSWGNCQLDLLSYLPSKMAYDVAVDIIDNPGGDCHLTFTVRDDLYNQSDAERVAASYMTLVNAFASQPGARLDEVDVFEEAEVEKALTMGRGPLYQSRQWGSTIIHRVDDIAKRLPNRAAVVGVDGSVTTYDRIVRKRVDEMVSNLEAAGITASSRVAVLQEPTPDWISSILAIMRLGATYVPLDMGSSWPRLQAIVNDCEPQAVVVNQDTAVHVDKLKRPEMQVVNIDSKPGHQAGYCTPVTATPDSASAILYTSGSTGTPKGIILTHRGLRSWLEPCGMLYGMKTTGEVVLQQSSQGFDMSLMQIFTALCFGGSVCLLPHGLRGDARAISEIIIRRNITHTYGTPSEYINWLRYCDLENLRKSSWKTALVGGEPLTASILKEFVALGKHDLAFHHMYGTTESTFCATVMELDYREEAKRDTSTGSPTNYPAGVALPNYNVYVLDELKRPLPVGLQGEIYVGGAGAAQGYLNQPSLTAETFVADPFATADDRARGWTMMQRTGDLGRWCRGDGDQNAMIIEGRISDDTMVKLRGLRVDLQDVEAAILRASADTLSEAIVSVRRSSPESPEFLVAHVVFTQDAKSGDEGEGHHVQRIRAQLDIPLYMQPSFIIAMDALPMMSSGKLDRKAIGALPLSREEAAVDDTALTSMEEKLKTIWEDVLHREPTQLPGINPETDFFHLGGSSLLLLGLRDKIRSQFGVELSLVDLFSASTLSSMAHRIEGQANTTESIDWDAETRLRPHMDNIDTSILQSLPPSDHLTVLLTGGSGYLGKAMVHAMIKNPRVKEIHCLGVRNVAARADLKDFEKVILHAGDLCQPRLGLPQSVIDDLFSRADVIIHNGADISYMKTYQSIRQSNFLITKDLVEWSMPRMIPFHYISTAGIGNLAPGSPLQERSMASTPPPTDGSMGYTACKWASERFLERLVLRHPEWPVCVHRPTLISRDDIPQLDGAHNILWYARKLGAVPASRGVARGVFNVVQLEDVVAGVLGCALRCRQDDSDRPDESTAHHHHQRGQVHFVNHAGKLDLPLNNMRKWALKRTDDGYVDFSGADLDEIPLNEWVHRAVECGMHPTMATLLTTFGDHGEVGFPTITKS